MTFQWDSSKNEVNIQKHGIDFEDAIDVFWDFHVILSAESRFGEIRELAIGMINGREVSVVHTWRGDDIRIISVRRARIDERELFYINRSRY